MYKVFVNEKRLSFNNSPEEGEKNIEYDGNQHSLEIVVDLLENTSSPSINVYHSDVENLWKDFSGIYKIIEAAGGLVLNDKNEILFIKRLGKWDLPKGKIEKGESLNEAALREIEEETGLKNVEIEKFFNTTYHIYTERNGKKILKTTHWFIMNYFGIETPVPQIEEGILEVTWKNEEAIKNDVLGQTFENIKLNLEKYQSEK